ncbi:MAG: MCP four helix bundle domain-containing protein [PVC group bacterium]
MKVGLQLGGGGLMMVIALTVCLVIFIEIGWLEKSAREISDDTLPSLTSIKDLELAMYRIRLGEKNHIIGITEEEHRAAEQRIAAAALFEAARDRHEQTLDDEAERKQFEHLLGRWDEYLAVHRRVLALSRSTEEADNDRLAQELSDTDGRHLFQMAELVGKSMEKVNIEVGLRAKERLITAYAHARMIVIGVALAVLVAGLLLSLYVIGGRN